MKKFGKENPLFENCEDVTLTFKSTGQKNDVLICKDNMGMFQMGADSLKYIYSIPGYDYVFGKTGDDVSTPLMQAGTCTKF